MKVKSTHSPVHGRSHNDVASGREGHTGDPARVLRESDEAETTEGVPHLDLPGVGVRGEGLGTAQAHMHGSSQPRPPPQLCTHPSLAPMREAWGVAGARVTPRGTSLHPRDMAAPMD